MSNLLREVFKFVPNEEKGAGSLCLSGGDVAWHVVVPCSSEQSPERNSAVSPADTSKREALALKGHVGSTPSIHPTLRLASLHSSWDLAPVSLAPQRLMQ